MKQQLLIWIKGSLISEGTFNSEEEVCNAALRWWEREVCDIVTFNPPVMYLVCPQFMPRLLRYVPPSSPRGHIEIGPG